jgi:hypothetical protein
MSSPPPQPNAASARRSEPELHGLSFGSFGVHNKDQIRRLTSLSLVQVHHWLQLLLSICLCPWVCNCSPPREQRDEDAEEGSFFSVCQDELSSPANFKEQRNFLRSFRTSSSSIQTSSLSSFHQVNLEELGELSSTHKGRNYHTPNRTRTHAPCLQRRTKRV